MQEMFSQEIANDVLRSAADECENDYSPSDCTVQQIVNYLDVTTGKQSIPEHFDIDLLREKVQWVKKSEVVEEDFTVKWNQRVWLEALSTDEMTYDEQGHPTTIAVAENFCGTAGCLAGNIALSSKQEIGWEAYGSEDGKTFFGAHTMADGKPIEIFAAQQLGLDYSERTLLFAAGNTSDDLVRISEAICQRRGFTF